MNNRVVSTKNRGLVTLLTLPPYNSNNLFLFLFYFIIILLNNKTKGVVY